MTKLIPLLSLVLLTACTVEEPAAPVTEPTAVVADPLTLTCGSVFDCRNNPPPKRSDGRTWLFQGSRYCKNDGGIFCEYVPSGLSSSFPTILFNTVPSSCQTCTSNNGQTSNCATTNYSISAYAWTCN